MYTFLHTSTKLAENQCFNKLTLICSKMDSFKSYYGIYKITQLTDTEKNAKKFFRVAPLPISGDFCTPCTPCKYLILNKLHI